MKNIIITLLFLSCFNTFGQVQVGGTPVSWEHSLNHADVQQITTPTLNMDQIAIEDTLDSINGVPPRFAYPHSVNLNLDNSGTWKQLADGSWIWRLKIHCPDALSISLLFDQYHLAPHSVLHFYNLRGSELQGGYTAWNNKGTETDPRGFATGIVFDDTAIVELHTTDEYKDSNILSVAFIAHGYNLSIFSNPQFTANFGIGKSKRCQTDVRCSPEGDDWQDEKKGVAMIVVDGTRICTGSLVNNSCEDGRLYFLTASHCLSSGLAENLMFDAWTFWWNYEAEHCDASNTDTYFTTTGAEPRMLLDQYYNDVALLELLESPMIAKNDLYFAYFNGWSRTEEPIEGGVGIHHPKGDVKKISLHDITPQGSGDTSLYVHWIDNGSNERYGIEPGSSGSPLFMNNGLIIGSLSEQESKFKCRATLNPNGQGAYYGIFALAWDEFPEPERQLETWLGNPECGAPQELEGGYFYDCPGNILINFPIWNTRYYVSEDNLTANAHIHDGADVVFTANDVIDLKAGFRVHNGALFSARIESCSDQIVNKRGGGDEDFSEDQEQTSSHLFTVFPNPSSGQVHIRIEEMNADLHAFEVFDMNGRKVYDKSNAEDLKRGLDVSLDLSVLGAGNYILKIRTSRDVFTSNIILNE